MKFFSLCLFVLSSFFAMADNNPKNYSKSQLYPFPEQDAQYLHQEEDENGYGCNSWRLNREGRSIRQPGGTWMDPPPEALCIGYCRPVQSGDEDIIVDCSGSTHVVYEEGGGSGRLFPCRGVADTPKEALAEARNVCNYKTRNECEGKENCNVSISCDPAQVCFRVYYGADGIPYILDLSG